MNSHVYFLLDRSGSMESIKTDVIGGFNQFIGDQKRGPNRCRLTLVQFDSQKLHEVVFNAADIDKTDIELTSGTFVPRGSTPLLDATAMLLDMAEARALAREADGKKAEAIVIVSFTDGEENSSRNTTRSELKERVEALRQKGWSFIYLGANQDAYQEAGSLGYASNDTHSFDADHDGTYRAYSTVTNSVIDSRTAATQ